ncbi:secD/SecF GG Motif family protein, partial [Vibrio parahaemolyticus V-223/04]
SYSQSS